MRPDSYSSTYSRRNVYAPWTIFMLILDQQACEGLGKFGIDVYHRFSDHVAKVIPLDDLPEEGSIKYYVLMANRDRFVHGRRLTGIDEFIPLTFLTGNYTRRIPTMGNLFYAYVSVGTPPLSFFVALDTGSNLSWLPCDCVNCLRGLKLPSGDELKFNIYHPRSSSTSIAVSCKDPLCPSSPSERCLEKKCAYEVVYLSNGTRSEGTLVEDVFHLTANDGHSGIYSASVILGCGAVQTGSFLEGAAPNGLLGLGPGNASVLSTLAGKNVVSNSFSMCFGGGGTGRIVLGDEGASDQRETATAFSSNTPSYAVVITGVGMGSNVSAMSFSAVFDSGTSFTYLNPPAYKLLSEMFRSHARGSRRTAHADNVPFEYCYDLGFNPKKFVAPAILLEMKGGEMFSVSHYIVYIDERAGEGRYSYCLAIFQSANLNIIGQNFMTGYNIVFDRRRNVIGWTPSNCYNETAPHGSNHHHLPPPPQTVSPSHAPSSSSSPFTTFLCILILFYFDPFM